MNVSIGARWEQFVDQIVKDGRYGSASEVVREGLRLVEERETRLKALRETIEAALADPRRFTFDEVIQELDADLDDWDKRHPEAAE
jgi:antitoxin ParD1/3/4